MKQNLLQIITQRMTEFSKGQRLIAQYILSHYDRAAYMTASKLGALVEVSESTVVRFANELGFDGYPEMQRALQELARTQLTAAQRMAVAQDLLDRDNVLEKVLLGDADKLRNTLESVDRAAFYDAVEKIAGARNVYILGVRSSAALAEFMTFNLRMIFDNVHAIVGTSGSEIFEQILDVGKDDVLVAISFPRYSKRTVRAAEYAHDAGASVVAITDSVASPLASVSDSLLTARSDMASFADSLVAPLSIINAILVAVSMHKQEEITDRLCRLEKIWDEYDVYDKT